MDTTNEQGQRHQLREFFFAAWQKHLNQQPIEPLEAQIIAVLKMHPEYHPVIEKKEDFLEHNFDISETGNPFLHLGLHLAIQEQIETDRPKGIRQIYYDLLHHRNNPHQVEHEMMDTLADILQHQSGNSPVSDPEYLEHLKKRL